MLRTKSKLTGLVFLEETVKVKKNENGMIVCLFGETERELEMTD